MKVKQKSQNEGVKMLLVESDHENRRLDHFLYSFCPNYPKSYLQKLIRGKRLLLNGKSTTANKRLLCNDEISIPYHEMFWGKDSPKTASLSLESCTARWKNLILHEDDDCIVVNKFSGVSVHSGSGLKTNVIDELRVVVGDSELQLCHRLDRYTSGCLVIAKRATFLRHFHEQLRSHQMEKIYSAELHGVPRYSQITVNENLQTVVGSSGIKMSIVSSDGKPAISHFRVLHKFKDTTIVEVKIEQGRLHQIRAHSKYLQHPIFGDVLYGGQRHADNYRLHCTQLGFVALDGVVIKTAAPPPTWAVL